MFQTIPLGLDQSLPESGESLFESLACQIEQSGLVVREQAVSGDLLARLVELGKLAEQADFHAAGIGRASGFGVNEAVRSDSIVWLDQHSELGRLWLSWAEQYRCYLNRRLLLGLNYFESHLAHYRPGDFYKTHLDSFRGQNNRFLTLILYLNPNWKHQEGGELVIYPESKAPITLLPEAGTLVSFLSEEFPHEVLPARRDRYSLTGWFRLDQALLRG